MACYFPPVDLEDGDDFWDEEEDEELEECPECGTALPLEQMQEDEYGNMVCGFCYDDEEDDSHRWEDD